jgi:hypothetical protein
MQGSVFNPKVWLHERVKRYVSDVLPINPNTPYV